MLRNVPFTMTWVTSAPPFFIFVVANDSKKAELKNVLDQTSHGRFDFLYLRMGKCANSYFCLWTSQSVSNLLIDFEANQKYVPGSGDASQMHH